MVSIVLVETFVMKFDHGIIEIPVFTCLPL